jgi:hypothetical protein
MKKLMTILLLGTWALALAQAPTSDEVATDTEEPDTVQPCVTEEEAVLLEDGQDYEICDEMAEAVEAKVEEEFKPGDEISEDYPIPLPADI